MDANWTHHEFGKISNDNGELRLSLMYRPDGQGYFHVFVCEDGKRNGHIISLDLDEYNRLRAIIKKADEGIKQLSSEGKLKKLG